MCGRAEPVDGGVRPKVGSSCEAKGSRGLYDVVIQACMALDGARGNASDSWHTELVRVSVEAWSQDGQGWWKRLVCG